MLAANAILLWSHLLTMWVGLTFLLAVLALAFALLLLIVPPQDGEALIPIEEKVGMVLMVLSIFLQAMSIYLAYIK